MMDRVGIKLAVRKRLQGCWGRLFLACLIPSLASSVLQFFTSQITVEIQLTNDLPIPLPAPQVLILSMLINVLVALPMEVTLSGYLLRVWRSREDCPSLAEVFECFGEHYGRYLRAIAWKWLKTSLWALLFQVASVYYIDAPSSFSLLLFAGSSLWMINRAIAYTFTPYILAENPALSGREALRQSCQMTKGRTLELFVALVLSFVGWYILGIVSLGIAMVYVLPYMTLTQTAYYVGLSDASNAH